MTGLGRALLEERIFRYLVDQWLVTMTNLHDAFSCGFKMDALHVERSYVRWPVLLVSSPVMQTACQRPPASFVLLFVTIHNVALRIDGAVTICLRVITVRHYAACQKHAPTSAKGSRMFSGIPFTTLPRRILKAGRETRYETNRSLGERCLSLATIS